MTIDTRSLTLFNGRAGDHNDRAMLGAPLLASELSRVTGLDVTTLGAPQEPLSVGWEVELEAALPELRQLAERYEQLFAAGHVPVTALSRCAVALATLPVVARHHPDAVVVWFDAHADLNSPETSTSGFLGGLVLAGAAGLWTTGLGGELELGNIVLGGVRDADPAEQELVDLGLVRLVKFGPGMLDDLRQAVGDRAVYFHLDCDVLEPGLVPTDYQVPGGLALDDLEAVCRVLAENPVVGMEFAEFEGSWEEGGAPFIPTDLVAALSPLVNAPVTH